MIDLPAGFYPRSTNPKKTGTYVVLLNDHTTWWAKFTVDVDWQKLIPKHLKIVGWSK
jgi:hypothetical protein